MDAFLWAMVSASIWGVVPLLEKIGLMKSTPLAGLFYRCIGVVIGLVVLLCVVKPREIRSVDPRSAFLLVLSGFLASFIAQICFYNGLKLGQVSRVVPVSGSYPFISFLLGVVLLGESFSPQKMAGVFLIITGIWVLRLG
jgi:transporter family protein